MKRGLVILAMVVLAFPFAGSAQHYLGVRGGYGNGTIRMKRGSVPVETGSLWGLYNGGLAYKYYTSEKYLGGVEIDFQYIQKGYTLPEPNKPDTVYAHKLNSLELPIFWQPHMYVLARKMRVFLNAGVVFSYNIDASERYYSKRDGDIYSWREYPMQLTRDNRWGYGLCAGAGINYIFGQFEFMGELRYSFGYSDLYKNANKYSGNPALSPMDNLYISVGVFYRLGKTGILSSPDKRTAAKIAEHEAARVAKNPGPASAPSQAAAPAVPAPAVPVSSTPAPVAPASSIPAPAVPQQNPDTDVRPGETQKN